MVCEFRPVSKGLMPFLCNGWLIVHAGINIWLNMYFPFSLSRSIQTRVQVRCAMRSRCLESGWETYNLALPLSESRWTHTFFNVLNPSTERPSLSELNWHGSFHLSLFSSGLTIRHRSMRVEDSGVVILRSDGVWCSVHAYPVLIRNFQNASRGRDFTHFGPNGYGPP